MTFLFKFIYLLITSKPYIKILFILVNISKSCFIYFLSLFVINTHSQLFQQYSNLKFYIYFILFLYFKYLLNYISLNIFILLTNLSSFLIDSLIIDIKLIQKFSKENIIEIKFTFLFIFSLLNLIQNHNRD